jgi:hypothetical protein
MKAGAPDGLLKSMPKMAWNLLLHTSPFFSKRQIPEDTALHSVIDHHVSLLFLSNFLALLGGLGQFLLGKPEALVVFLGILVKFKDLGFPLRI